MPVPGAPTVKAPAPQATAKQQTPVIPFVRASHQKSRLVFNLGPTTLNTTVQAVTPQQIPAAGFFRWLNVTVTGTAAGNSAAVAFQNDAPFNVLQQIQLLTASGDTLISVIDGFSLYVINKYFCLSTGFWDPVADPNYSVTTGTGGTGGSFTFQIRIPIEIDSRDALGALANMAANQSFLLQMSLNTLANIYSVAPTNAPTVSLVGVMEYWSAPAASNQNGDTQAVFPFGNGTANLIQTQTPTINASTQQNIQMLNVGNVVRAKAFILRDSSQVRTDAAWPNVTNFYVNNDPWMYKTKANWKTAMARAYRITGGTSATPAANTLDNGVYILSDFIDDGASGAFVAQAACDRNAWLVTNSATAFNIEAVNWGSGASSLLILDNIIRPSSPQALYNPQFI